MESAVLNKLDELFREVRQELRRKRAVEHAAAVQHDQRCSSVAADAVKKSRRHSMPGRTPATRRDSFPRMGTAESAAVAAAAAAAAAAGAVARQPPLPLPPLASTQPNRRSSLPTMPLRRDSIVADSARLFSQVNNDGSL